MTAPPLYTPRQLEDIKGRTRLSALVGRVVKLRKAGRDWMGLCPFHKEKTPSFSVRDESGTFHCFGCGAHGDAFAWLMETQRLSFTEAVERLAGDAGVDGPVSIRQREGPKRGEEIGGAVDSSIVGRWIWSTAQPARGSIVEAWLRARGLDPEGVPGALDRLRFHPRCPIVAWLERGSAGQLHRKGLTAPAMVAPISTPEGDVHGVHCTFLRPDGAGKASLPAAPGGKERETRKIFGRLQGLGVWLTPPRGDGLLVVGEGIETTWSEAEDQWRDKGPCRAGAALSLDNLQGSPDRLRDGSLPLWRPRHDPSRPLFLLERPGDVLIVVDADMKPLRGQNVQLARGAKPVRADISGLQRAELCAALATQAWRRVGAVRVRAIRPPMGFDRNDLKRRAAA